MKYGSLSATFAVPAATSTIQIRKCVSWNVSFRPLGDQLGAYGRLGSGNTISRAAPSPS